MQKQRVQIPSLSAICIISLLAGCGNLAPGRAAGVATGYVSHQLCSATFVAKLDPDQYFHEAIEPMAAPVGFLLSYQVDREHREVSAWVAGMAESKAVYRGAMGCQVEHGATLGMPELAPLAATASLLPPLGGPAVVETDDPALKAALDRAFVEQDKPPYRNTKAVVIVHDGKIIAERYAPGIGIDTPLTGWSATKSVNNALIGILVREGKLSVSEPAPVAAWSDPHDPRHAITIDNLLRMTSGLDIGDSIKAGLASIIDPSTQMLFDENDMGVYAERARLAVGPGTGWKYTDASAILLSRIVRDQVGGSEASVYAFAHRELFDKLGMQNVTLEFDGAGTPIGSSHMWAPARAWARFGMLYLHDGGIGGERILPPGWVDYSAALTAGSETYGYGAGFWTNRGESSGGRRRIGGGMPADAFLARGSQGQYVVIVPSQNLVVARLGPAFTHYDDIDVVDRLVADVVAVVDKK
jgi:CubicO group peptidase (beta-lactamase class C family)